MTRNEIDTELLACITNVSDKPSALNDSVVPKVDNDVSITFQEEVRNAILPLVQSLKSIQDKLARTNN